ncbi:MULTISPECIES: cation-translocating P-type ATPase [unclassified Streptomyces]|uniref:heavy metal translocating P-type ATPase n=1 Tax=unclassified Streptomyces TaxID=2593676 RepID=UPI0009CCDB48|nr:MULTISPECIES: cation-translocating P-type ATPase [unclassified Streptomyces]ONI49962.1 putative cation-transporting ATPase G [Streptomyces sp. IB2014 011-1]
MADECCGTGPTTSTLWGAAAPTPPSRVWQVRELQAAAASGVLLGASFLAPGAWSTPLMLAALAVGAATFAPGAVRALLRGGLGVGLLMTIAAAGAVALGEYGEAATLAFLFSIAEGLEGYALARTRHGLRALLDLVPPNAAVLRGNAEHQVEPADLVVGDILVVRPGEKIATDGTVRAGRSALDTSVVTGESVPSEVGPGSEVFAGTINGAGVLEVAVTATAEDNSLARLVHIVQDAQERKGNSQRLAARFARPLVPGVLVLAALIAAVGSLFGDPGVWIERALVVLVAAAPCAFALSVPIAVVAAVGAASKAGVLIKGGAAVEALGAVRVVALDKTGTLTRNNPAVVDVVTTPGIERNRVLGIAAALEARSEHPLAAAILTAADKLPFPGAQDVEAVPGNGLTGAVEGAPARLGKPGFIDAGALGTEVARLQSAGATVVLVEHDNAVLGAVAVRDEIRPEAFEAVVRLKRQGIQVVMLTGDNTRTAEAIAADAGITDVRAELLPEDKARIVTELSARGATASTTPPPSPPPTPASPWAPWAATSRSKPPTSPSWAKTCAACPTPSPTPAPPAPSSPRTSSSPAPYSSPSSPSPASASWVWQPWSPPTNSPKSSSSPTASAPDARPACPTTSPSKTPPSSSPGRPPHCCCRPLTGAPTDAASFQPTHPHAPTTGRPCSSRLPHARSPRTPALPRPRTGPCCCPWPRAHPPRARHPPRRARPPRRHHTGNP